ncbi:MAG: hypothetical protein HY719_07335 [Planctomycetes bacterium]|nr:hypothetical protein [Planctomycetota bacterium]
MSKISVTIIDRVAARTRHVKLKLPGSKTAAELADFLARKYDHLADANFIITLGGREVDLAATLGDLAAASAEAEFTLEVRPRLPRVETESESPAAASAPEASFAASLAAFEAAEPGASSPPAAVSAGADAGAPAAASPLADVVIPADRAAAAGGTVEIAPDKKEESGDYATPPPSGDYDGPATGNLADALAGLEDEDDGAESFPPRAGAAAPVDDARDADAEADEIASGPAGAGESDEAEPTEAPDAVASEETAIPAEAAEPEVAAPEGVTPLPTGPYAGEPTGDLADALAELPAPADPGYATPRPAGPYAGDSTGSRAEELAEVEAPEGDTLSTPLPRPRYVGPPTSPLADELADLDSPLGVGAAPPAPPAPFPAPAVGGVFGWDLSAPDAGKAGRAAPPPPPAPVAPLENEDFEVAPARANASAALPVLGEAENETAELPAAPPPLPPSPLARRAPGLADVLPEDRPPTPTAPAAAAGAAPSPPPAPVPAIREIVGDGAERVRAGFHEAERRRADTGRAEAAGPEPLTLRRRATTTYYERMTLHNTFPCTVAITRDSADADAEVRRGAQGDVTRAGARALEIAAAEPMVTVRAVFPGCIVTASDVDLDVSADRAEARFWITPFARGEHLDAYVEVRHRGRAIERIATPVVVASRGPAVATLATGAVFPLLSVSGSMYTDAVRQTAEVRDPGNFVFYFFRNIWWGVLLLIPFAAAAAVLWRLTRPRDAGPIERAIAVQTVAAR